MTRSPGKAPASRTPALESRSFVIKAPVTELAANAFMFTGQKTMYGGKDISEGDTIFVFASESEGGGPIVFRQ